MGTRTDAQTSRTCRRRQFVVRITHTRRRHTIRRTQQCRVTTKNETSTYEHITQTHTHTTHNEALIAGTCVRALIILYERNIHFATHCVLFFSSMSCIRVLLVRRSLCWMRRTQWVSNTRTYTQTQKMHIYAKQRTTSRRQRRVSTHNNGRFYSWGRRGEVLQYYTDASVSATHEDRTKKTPDDNYTHSSCTRAYACTPNTHTKKRTLSRVHK